ncbi:MAG: DUF3786 domain-containing protein [Methanomassiliicoccales archaeon]|nr:MAG: DUF3786 domain-containing protein [Methanomassiliicoccales archaeon]
MKSARQGEMCYLPSLERAWDMLADLDLRVAAERAGGRAEGSMILIRMLNGEASIEPGRRRIECNVPGSGFLLEIVVLHYVKGCLDNAPSKGKEWLLFRQLPGGEVFQPAFQKRVVQGIAKRFSSRPDELLRAGLSLGGRKEDLGDATVVLPFFPRLEVRVTVWEGDDEVPGSATLLFSPETPSLLPTEDLTEVGEVVLSALLKAVNKGR